jgi:hypothetical protein
MKMKYIEIIYRITEQYPNDVKNILDCVKEFLKFIPVCKNYKHHVQKPLHPNPLHHSTLHVYQTHGIGQ